MDHLTSLDRFVGVRPGQFVHDGRVDSPSDYRRGDPGSDSDYSRPIPGEDVTKRLKQNSKNKQETRI
jgi:hypothetical protein